MKTSGFISICNRPRFAATSDSPQKAGKHLHCYLHCRSLTDVQKLRKFRDLWSGGKSKAHSRLFERGTRWSQ